MDRPAPAVVMAPGAGEACAAGRSAVGSSGRLGAHVTHASLAGAPAPKCSPAHRLARPGTTRCPPTLQQLQEQGEGAGAVQPGYHLQVRSARDSVLGQAGA